MSITTAVLTFEGLQPWQFEAIHAVAEQVPTPAELRLKQECNELRGQLANIALDCDMPISEIMTLQSKDNGALASRLRELLAQLRAQTRAAVPVKP